MTDEQLETARSHIDWHMRAFGYERRNVKFLNGYIEKLGELDLEPESFNVIVSNCVINLSVDKPAVLRERRSGRAAGCLRSRRASSDRAREGISGVWQYMAYAGRHSLCPPFRLHRRFLDPLRDLPWLRNFHPLRDDLGNGNKRELLLLGMFTVIRVTAKSQSH
jgi:hypothetical protein